MKLTLFINNINTWSLPSRLLGIVTHLLGCPGQLSAFSNSSMAPLVFLSFLTSASTAFSAHFSSSSPCFHPNNFLTAGLVNENRLFIDEIVDDERPESNSSTSIARREVLRPDDEPDKRNEYKNGHIHNKINITGCGLLSTTHLVIFIYCCCLVHWWKRERKTRIID